MLTPFLVSTFNTQTPQSTSIRYFILGGCVAPLILVRKVSSFFRVFFIDTFKVQRVRSTGFVLPSDDILKYTSTPVTENERGIPVKNQVFTYEIFALCVTTGRLDLTKPGFLQKEKSYSIYYTV